MSKVPAVTLAFWLIKIACTTLGETGGDMMSMSFGFGYADSTAIYFPLFAIAVFLQIRAKTYNPALYWFVIVTTTLTGTTVADFCDRSLHIGYVGGSTLLFAAVLACLGAWRLACGRVSASDIATPRMEAFYWATIFASNTLGTALGDLTSDSSGFGFLGSSGFFALLLAGLVGLHFWTRLSPVLLFWAGFILTRPFGASFGDFLTKPVVAGGLDLSRVTASAALAVAVSVAVLLFSRNAGQHPHQDAAM